MPRDLFGDVVSGPPSVRSRRTPLVVASIVGHATILVLLVVTTLVAADGLPMPREALAYFDTSVRMADIKLPAPPPPPPKTVIKTPDAGALNPNLAPTVAPDGIAPEPVRELVDSGGTVNGVDGVIGAHGAELLVIDAPPPPPPAPTTRDPIRLHSGIRAPQKIVNVAPIYPSLAQIARKEGLVIIEATIDVQGNVTDARVLRPAPLLEEAALAAVRQWRFTPALLNGVPIPVIMTITVNFTLQK